MLAIWGVGLGLGGMAEPAFAARQPVVVELFTAQGCSSCVGSNQIISDLADDARVLPLTFGVDYWDYLGWTDTFAKPEFTARQRAYMAAFGLREIYTPQLVVDGRLQVAALPLNQAETLVRQAQTTPRDPPDIVFRADKTRVLQGLPPAGRRHRRPAPGGHRADTQGREDPRGQGRLLAAASAIDPFSHG